MTVTPTHGDHPEDAGSPRFRLPRPARTRFAVLTTATVVLAVGIVLVVAELLPVLAAWVLPTLLAVLTAVFLTAGRRAAAGGATAGARAWAAWAGATATFAIAGAVDLAGLGGALVAVLLAAIAANAGIALWFRSPVHAVVVQVAGLAWGAIAHVYGVVPWALLVLGVAGLWWIGTVGAARVVVVSTTVTLPIAVTLLVHPLTHRSPAVDGADVAVLIGAVAVALTGLAVIGRSRPVVTVWAVARATAVVVLVAQVVAGAVPAVQTALAPTDPWPSVLVGAAAVLAAAAVVVARRTRAGIVTVLVLGGLQLAELVAALTLGAPTATAVGLGGLFALALVLLVRTRRTLLWLPVLVLPAVLVALLGLPTPVIAAVLVTSGGGVAVALTVGSRR